MTAAAASQRTGTFIAIKEHQRFAKLPTQCLSTATSAHGWVSNVARHGSVSNGLQTGPSIGVQLGL